mgnify:FL=1
MNANASTALAHAITLAKRRGAEEVSADDLLLGGLQAWSRFGIAKIGPWEIDVEALGANWMEQPEKAKVAYSQDAVDVMDLAAKIARTDPKAVGAPLLTGHLLAAFAGRSDGLMDRIKQQYGVTSAAWRSAIAELCDPKPATSSSAEESPAPPPPSASEYLSPEQAAEELGVHVQTMRAYVRSGRVPALRIAGERVLRIRREDLHKIFEPVPHPSVEQPD